jgi:hypothetical protein
LRTAADYKLILADGWEVEVTNVRNRDGGSRSTSGMAHAGIFERAAHLSRVA